jgi:hypothetical protein
VVKILPCRVEQRERLAPDVMRLYLKLAERRTPAISGWANMSIFCWPMGAAAAFRWRIRRTPTICLELHVRQVPGGYFTGYVFDKMKDKALLRFQGPLGTFFLREDSPRPILLDRRRHRLRAAERAYWNTLSISAWSGPCTCTGARGQKPICIWTRCRVEWERNASEFPLYAGAYRNLMRTTLGEAAPAGCTKRSPPIIPIYSDYEVYMSGPPPMIEAAKPVFAAQGFAGERLFYDSFELRAALRRRHSPEKRGLRKTTLARQSFPDRRSSSLGRWRGRLDASGPRSCCAAFPCRQHRALLSPAVCRPVSRNPVVVTLHPRRSARAGTVQQLAQFLIGVGRRHAVWMLRSR